LENSGSKGDRTQIHFAASKTVDYGRNCSIPTSTGRNNSTPSHVCSQFWLGITRDRMPALLALNPTWRPVVRRFLVKKESQIPATESGEVRENAVETMPITALLGQRTCFKPARSIKGKLRIWFVGDSCANPGTVAVRASTRDFGRGVLRNM
jgi:hypothetical protein